MLDVRRLRVLGAVARHGSFSAAAAALGYTQPAVSRQVALLEAETGTLLVRRLPQGIQLTDAGRLLVQRGEAIIAQLDGLEAELGALAGLEGGRLRFGAFASACASIVPLAIARFRDRHPAVELSVRIVEPEESLPTLRAGELDLAISNDPHSASPRAAAQASAHTVKADGYAVDAVPHGAGAGAGGAVTSAHAGGTGAHGGSMGLHGGGTGLH